MNMNLVGNRLREIGPQLEELDRRTKELVLSRVSGGRGPTVAPGSSSGPESTGSLSTTADSAGTGSSEIYTIKAGDNFTNIAKRYKVSLNDLMQANPGVDPQRLQIGQEIRIP